METSLKAQSRHNPSPAAEDATRQYCTEDTSAILSNSNLSILLLETRTDGNDGEDEQLLEAAIQSEISTRFHENLIEKRRRRALLPYCWLAMKWNSIKWKTVPEQCQLLRSYRISP